MFGVRCGNCAVLVSVVVVSSLYVVRVLVDKAHRNQAAIRVAVRVSRMSRTIRKFSGDAVDAIAEGTPP